MNDSSYFLPILSEVFGGAPNLILSSNLSGGCIHRVYHLCTSLGEYCIKINDSDSLSMFMSESMDLELLGSTKAVRIPEVFGYGKMADISYLIMEYIKPAGRKKNYWNQLGHDLASLHKNSNFYYGLEYNNYIGSLPQINSKKNSWMDFYINKRLEEQIQLGILNGRISTTFSKKIELLYAKLPSILLEESPALLHGDLWSGNIITDERGYAALIDPSVYFGNREIEIAFTTLFGGFDNEFYDSYNEAFPLEKGFKERREIYLLYPLLVHSNLFGGGYAAEAESIIDKYS